MNISWVLSDQTTLDPTIEISRLKNLGSIWGSWKTWRAYQTDNVICHDMPKANELIKRQFQNTCNFYIPNSIYQSLGRPEKVNLYEGTFVHDVNNQEEIIAMHLAASRSDIVLLVGFDFSEKDPNPDKLLEHRAHNYRGMVRQAILNNEQVQWVAIDHHLPLRKDLASCSNLGQDTLDNVLN